MKKSLLLLSTIMCLSVPIFASAECQHDWSDWVVYDATCGEDGEKWRECLECYEREEVVLPATGNHIWGKWEVEEEADCIYDGRKYRDCSVCGAWEDIEIPATGVHRWDEWEVENATCGDDGYKSRECLDCGKYEETILKATGKHTWGKWKVEKETSCFTDGEKVRYCTVCDDDKAFQSKVIKAPRKHTWGKWYILEEPNCLNSGKAYRQCQECFDEQYKILKKDPKKHDYGQWYVTKKSTAFETGSMERICCYCQKTEKKSVSKLKTAKAATKDEKQALKIVTNFFSYAKQYDAKKIKKCFASPNKVKLFIEKKYLAKFCKSNNNKYLKYAIKSIKAGKKTATITAYCKYYDAYYPHCNSMYDMILYVSEHPKASSSQIDKTQYNSLVKWVKKDKKSYTYKTLKFSLKKINNSWKIVSYTKDMNNAIHANYQNAYDSVF